MQIDRAVDQYLLYLQHEKNMSPKTLENYSLWLGRLLEHVGDIALSDLNQMMLMDWRMSLTNRGLATQTINYHVTSVRALLKFCHKMDLECIAPEKLELAKVPPREVSHLSAQEVTALLHAPTDHCDDMRQCSRDTAILQTLYGSGLRVSELIALRIDQLPSQGNQLSLVGKGRKVRSVFLTDQARAAIQAHINQRADTNPYIFTSQSNRSAPDRPLTRNSVERLVKRYAMLAGITSTVTPHTLRHSFATALIKKGADIRSVQVLLGHASITTTQIYTHVDDRHLQSVHDLLSDDVLAGS